MDGEPHLFEGTVSETREHRRRSNGGPSRWWRWLLAAFWVFGGAVVLVWLGRSLELLPQALAVLLILGGLASLGDVVTCGRFAQRLLAACWGSAQIVFGILSLTWPDATLLAVAVAFGIRTIAFGDALFARGPREWTGPNHSLIYEKPDAETRRRQDLLADGARCALALVLVVTASAGWWVNEWR